MEEVNQDQKEPSIAFTTVSEKWYKRDSFRKFFNITTGILIVLLAPFTVAAIISQNAIPGDVLYPLKRGMENMVLAAATVSPATRAAFRTDLAQRRFNEAEKLLLRGDVNGLNTFISEIQASQVELKQVTDTKKKEELTQKLIVSIGEYQRRLTQVEEQVQKQEAAQVIPTTLPEVSVTPTSYTQAPSATTAQSISPTGVHPSISPTRVQTPTIYITIFPSHSVTPLVTRLPTTPPMPTPTPTPTPSGPIGGAIGQTREDLERILRSLEEQQRRHQSVGSQSLAPQSTEQSSTQSKSEKQKEEKKEKKVNPTTTQTSTASSSASH